MNDDVDQLRVRGRLDLVYTLPSPRVRRTIGTESELRLDDPSGLMSREHGELIPLMDAAGGWKLRDMNSKNGLRFDGERHAAFKLRPGLEIEIGGLRLVAESPQLIRVLEALRCLLGWGAAQQDVVDTALQSLRAWAAQRGDLLVVGDGDLGLVMRRIHDLVIGPRSSFIVVEGEVNPDDAVRSALGGTLCLPVHRQGLATAIVERVHSLDYSSRPQLVVCAAIPSMAMTIKRVLDRAAVIEIPKLGTRADEMERIVREVAKYKSAEFNVPESKLTTHDMERLTVIEYDGFDDLEETVRRLVAIRVFGVTEGARLVGLDHSSLGSWARYHTRKLIL